MMMLDCCTVGSLKHQDNIPMSLLIPLPLPSHQTDPSRWSLCFTNPTSFPQSQSISDPYHTHLSTAAAAIVSTDPAWGLQPMAKWAKEHVSAAAPTPLQAESKW